MNQTPPYDPTALIVEPTDPSSAASWRAGPRRRAIPLLAGALALRSQGSVAELKPGQTVIVSGQTGSDGSVTADRIAVGAPR